MEFPTVNDFSPHDRAVGAIIAHLPTPHRICIGTLIARDRILTAAHCLQSHDPSRYRFVIWNDTGEHIYNLSAVYIHPEFRGSDEADVSAHDIAVGVLDGAAEGIYQERLTHGPAWEKSREVTALRYDITRPEVGLPPLAPSTQQISWKTPMEFSTTTMQGPALCHGDSGAPAFIFDAAGGRHLVGILSRGSRSDCSSESIFSRIDFYLEWIEGIGAAKLWSRGALPATALVGCLVGTSILHRWWTSRPHRRRGPRTSGTAIKRSATR